MATQLDRIEKMLAALCDHLGIDVGNVSPTKPAKDLSAENGRRYDGIVSRFEHGWGFIESAELGRNLFVHYSDVEGIGLRLLGVGEEVSFEVAPGKDGRPKAARVRRQRTTQAKPEPPQAAAASSQEAAGIDAGLPRLEDASSEEDDMPQPESSEALPLRSSPRRTNTRRARLGALPGRRPAISW